MKKIALILILITTVWSLDITKAVELGLEKKSQFMDTTQKLNKGNQADAKLYITDGTIKKS